MFVQYTVASKPLHVFATGTFIMSGRRTLTKLRCTATYRIPKSSRSYHSYEHDLSPPYAPAQDRILAAAINHVPAHGFTTTALSSGVRDAGYPDVSANLFPDGVSSLVKYHLVTERLALSKNAPTDPATESSNVLDRVRNLTLQRLHASKPIIHRWQEVRCPSHIVCVCIEAYQECRRLQS